MHKIVTGYHSPWLVEIQQHIQQAGAECQSEKVFNLMTTYASIERDLPLRCKDIFEFSWAALPWLSHSLLRGAHVYHLVRNPVVAVLQGYRSLPRVDDEQWAEHSERMRFLYRNVPYLLGTTDRFSSIAMLYICWNHAIEHYAPPHNRFRVEDQQPEFFAATGVTGVDSFVIKQYQHPGVDFSSDDIPDGAVKANLLAMATRYGYVV